MSRLNAFLEVFRAFQSVLYLFQLSWILPAMHSTRPETRGIDPETSEARDLSLRKLPKVSERFANNFNSSTKTSQSEAVMDRFEKNSTTGSATKRWKMKLQKKPIVLFDNIFSQRFHSAKTLALAWTGRKTSTIFLPQQRVPPKPSITHIVNIKTWTHENLAFADAQKQQFFRFVGNNETKDGEYREQRSLHERKFIAVREHQSIGNFEKVTGYAESRRFQSEFQSQQCEFQYLSE